MPQFDPQYFVSQIFWLCIIFAIFFLVLWRVVLPRIGAVMDARENQRINDLALAEKARADSAEIRQAYEAELAKTRQSAQELIQAENLALTKKTNQKIETLEKRLHTEILAAEKRIEATHQKALAEMEVIARDLTGGVVQKIAGGRRPAIKTIENALKHTT